MPVTLSVWVYYAVTALPNTVTLSETLSVSLVQITVVAGPPIEIHVRVN